jgi:FkbM family methyltransferase
MLRNLLRDIHLASATSVRDRSRVPAQPSPCEQWLDALIARMFQLMHNMEQNNFDASRYRNEAPNAFFYDRHAAYFSFVLKHADEFHDARTLLCDDASRGLFDQLVLFRLLGHLHVRLPFNTPENRAKLATAEQWRVEDTRDVSAFGPLSIFRVPGEEHDIRVKGLKENVIWTFLYKQYYFERGGVAIKPERGDRVVDAGGCFGDTALGFADTVGEHGHVYVFDPLPKHCAIMREQLAMNPGLAPRISVFPLGLSDHVNDVSPLADDGVIDPGARVISPAVPITTIDEVVARGNVPHVDLIKMDIEGSELSALRGAEATIRRWRPKLAISLYHRPEDFFSIPFWIESLGIGYQLFLDHYSIHHEETVLYAAV